MAQHKIHPYCTKIHPWEYLDANNSSEVHLSPQCFKGKSVHGQVGSFCFNLIN